MSRFFITRPVFSSVLSLLIVLVGALAIPSLPVSQYPSLSLPQVNVTSVYTGASAEVVETAVTTPARAPGCQRHENRDSGCIC